jgi:serine/threonine protein phosphatase PrpC
MPQDPPGQPAADVPAPADARKPRDDEIDVYGLTHQGRVRSSNQDHFLLASIHKRVEVSLTSLSARDRLPFGDERLALLAMVADGVGSGEGETASRTALEIALRYVAGSMDCYYRGGDSSEAAFTTALQDAAMRCHEAVAERRRSAPAARSMATTLTLWMGVWPWHYLLQVGDSRYYLYREDVLTQVSRDQTLAQDLVDQGVFSRAVGARSPLARVLSSSIGGENSMPVVTRMRTGWYNVHLLCSDGLTKHVTDARIAEQLGAMTSAKQVCEQLLQDALDGGGTDNVTIVVGRTVPKEPPA